MIKALMLLLGAGKLGKVLLTSGTMLLSVITYSFVFGWGYAVGFVVLIFIHEMGHYIAARQRGLEVGAPTFIPFVGAWIEMKSLPHDAETEAYVGLGGPLAGTLGAFACYFLARAQGSDLLLALAYAGFMLNLFNMLPISPLDGGRIVAVISPKIWYTGEPFSQKHQIVFDALRLTRTDAPATTGDTSSSGGTTGDTSATTDASASATDASASATDASASATTSATSETSDTSATSDTDAGSASATGASATGASATGASATGVDQDPADQGCGCRSAASPPLWALLPLAARRRRRRAA
ncbi:MAG TPA: site-2 protease family protein [Nannocystaceae bacterium]|nr:site-2 protease family protein [Nannocystaceae bacterium]